jgi:hypothetical protein
VKGAYAALVNSSDRDELIAAAASVRDQTPGTYRRRSLSGSLPQPGSQSAPVGDPDSSAAARPSPHVESLVRRLLQCGDDDREAVLAPLTPWTEDTERTLREWLPVTSRLDADILGSLAIGGPEWSLRSPGLDRSVAALMSPEDGALEDLFPALRAIILTLQSGAAEVLNNGVGELTTSRLLALRTLITEAREIDGQVPVLAELLDLVASLGPLPSR